MVQIKFNLPELFRDAETGEPLSDSAWEKIIKIAPQYTETQFEVLLDQASTAASVGAALSIW